MADKDLEELRQRVLEAKQRNGELKVRASGAEDVLPIERKVQELKDALRAAEERAEAHARGISEYQQRTADTEATTAASMDRLASQLQAAMADAAKDDEEVVAGDVAAAGTEALAEIHTEREKELQELTAKLVELREQDEEVSARVAELKAKAEQEVPAIEAAALKTAEELTAAWTKERDELRAIYDRLLQINREHQYHLSRGTHVKKAAQPAVTTHARHEAALSARHAQLAAQLIDSKAKLDDVTKENGFAEKANRRLREEGRDTAAKYNDLKADVAARLEDVVQERERVQAEVSRFRDLKSEMQQALVAMRDAPSGTLRRR